MISLATCCLEFTIHFLLILGWSVRCRWLSQKWAGKCLIGSLSIYLKGKQYDWEGSVLASLSEQSLRQVTAAEGCLSGIRWTWTENICSHLISCSFVLWTGILLCNDWTITVLNWNFWNWCWDTWYCQSLPPNNSNVCHHTTSGMSSSSVVQLDHFTTQSCLQETGSFTMLTTVCWPQ